MKFTAEQKLLADWLQHSAAVADDKSPAKVFQCVRLDVDEGTLSLSATNALFNMSTAGLPLLGVTEPGSTSTPADRLAKVVGSLRANTPVEIDYQPGNDILRVKSGRTNLTLDAVDPMDLPVFINKFPDPQLTLNAVELDRALAFTMPAMGETQDLPALWGIALLYDVEKEKVFATATNGKIGAICCLATTAAAEFPTIILPRPLAQKLRAILKGNTGEVEVGLTSRGVRFATDRWTVITKIVDAIPPHTRFWLPNRIADPVEVDSSELAAIAARLEAATDMDSAKLKQHGALVTFADQMLNIRDGRDSFDDAINVAYKGEPSEIGVNILHIREALATIGADEVELHISDRESPVLICGKGIEDDAFVTSAYRV